MSDTEVCPSCGNEYKGLGSHWSASDCDHPPLTKKQKEVATGLLMGDGCLGRNSKHPFLVTSMVSKNYLEYIDDIFGILSTGVSFYKSSEKLAEEKIDSDLNFSSDSKNYKDVYRWNTRTHPEFSNINWYKSGEKRFPDSIDLTPTVLKHWYCCDGHYSNKEGHSRIEIAISNEIDQKEKLNSIFKNASLPTPSRYRKTIRKNGTVKGSLRFTKENSNELFEYMGKPLPDFSYKFPSWV
jgi:hypothetical protein